MPVAVVGVRSCAGAGERAFQPRQSGPAVAWVTSAIPVWLAVPPWPAAREDRGMTSPANDPQAVRPEVVLLLLDIDQAAGGIGNGAACHADGRLLDRGELALIESRTPAEERAVAALTDAGWQRWHRRAEALARIMAIIGEAPPLARANFDAMLWACGPSRPGRDDAPGIRHMARCRRPGWPRWRSCRSCRHRCVRKRSGFCRSLILPAHDCAISRVAHGTWRRAGRDRNLTTNGAGIRPLANTGLNRRYLGSFREACGEAVGYFAAGDRFLTGGP